ncbi:hypothetical protein EDD16DRAFT_89270 [Pisolithus croceorrhizus]|nr:hypothetical protein EDD16DRAFT_89270 [Pisolithus croceorrhizus]KAI6158364.1 hypothetical protein EDD17DRAFT_1015056 [Pisolithus thermaeus]
MKQGRRPWFFFSAENHRPHETNPRVNRRNDLTSGVRTEGAVPKSRATDHTPLAPTDSRPESSPESREPTTLHSKAPSSGFGAEDAIVLIIGPAGSGKSSFISRAAGNADEGVGHDLLAGPYTKEVRETKCMIDGISITLVDIPALDGATSEVVILSMVSGWLNQTKRSKAHISAVLLFHPIADNRMRWMPWNLFYRFREWCGHELASRTRIDLVTTMWDEADGESGNERLAELEGDHWKPMLESGSTILRYQNTPESATELLRAVLSKKPNQIQSAGAFLPTGPGGIRDYATIGKRLAFSQNDAAPHKVAYEAREVQLSELSTQDILILIIGPVGCGKSSFIGKAVGKEEGIGHTLCTGSYTKEIRATRCTIGNFTNAVLLDTPGFDSMRTSERKVLDMVYRSLQDVHKGRISLSAILLLHPITDIRLRWTPLEHPRLFQKLCSKEAMAQTGLVTTMWDEVEEDLGNERMTALNSNYWRAMIALGSKTYRFWNTGDAARELLQEVISKCERRRAI